MTMAVPARRLARSLLVDGGERWAHTQGVAARAGELAAAVGLHVVAADRLVAAAWLHDIGYADRLQGTGFHPLDGARHLARWSWPPGLAALVAQHSGARFVADVRGLGGELAAFPVVAGDVALLDLLTYADQTVGPAGLPMAVDERIEEAFRRRGPRSPSGRAYPWRRPYLLAVAARVQTWLGCPAGG